MAAKLPLPIPEGIFRLSGAQFLSALAILLVAMPFLNETPNGMLMEGGLLTIVLLSGVAAVGGKRSSFIVAVLLVIPRWRSAGFIIFGQHCSRSRCRWRRP